MNATSSNGCPYRIDINAYIRMRNGASEEKVEVALGEYRKSPLFSLREKLALELCERMTYTNKRVTDRFFNRLKRHLARKNWWNSLRSSLWRTSAASSIPFSR